MGIDALQTELDGDQLFPSEAEAQEGDQFALRHAITAMGLPTLPAQPERLGEQRAWSQHRVARQVTAA
jgi:hypothetical protein